MEDYRTIRGTATGEYEEKKSRFIAQLSFADSEEKAVAFLEQVRATERPGTMSMPTACGRATGSATPMTVNRPRRREPRRWKYCSTAV